MPCAKQVSYGCVGIRCTPRNASDLFVLLCGPIQGTSPVGSTPIHGQSKGWSSGDRRGSEQRLGGRPGSGSGFSGHALKAHGVERDGREAERGRPQSLSVEFEHKSVVSGLQTKLRRSVDRCDRYLWYRYINSACHLFVRPPHVAVRIIRRERKTPHLYSGDIAYC